MKRVNFGWLLRVHVVFAAAAADEANNRSLICVCHDPFIPRINFSLASCVCVCVSTSALKC